MFTKPFLCPSWQVLTLAALHDGETYNVRSHTPDNRTMIKYYYLLYSNPITNSYVVPFLRR